MNQPLDLFPLDRDALETELKDREGLFWLFMVYFPKQRYYRPDVTKRQREKAEEQDRRPMHPDYYKANPDVVEPKPIQIKPDN